MRPGLALALAGLVLSAPPAPATAQEARPGVEIQLPGPTRLTEEGPLVRARSVLDNPRTRQLLESGFPTRLHYRVELWASNRFVDELQQTAEWDVVVRLRGVDRTYEVIQVIGERELSLGAFQRLTDAENAAERPLRVPLRAPAEDRRFYYRVALDVRTMSVSDLDEVGRWLSGELQPAVRGERNPGTALGRGFRSLTTRLLGGERREYVTRSASFRPPL